MGSTDGAWFKIKIIYKEVEKILMNYNNEYEEEIDLKDLLFFELYKWRSIILAAVIMGILFGGYKVVSETVLKQNSEIVVETEEYEKKKVDYERAVSIYEREIENLQKMIVEQKVYLDNSILMDISPYEKPEASADIFVKLDDLEVLPSLEMINLDPTDSIVKAYASGIEHYIDWKELVNELGVDEVYLKELVSTNIDYNSNTFHVKVCYSDLKTADRVLDVILQQIEQRQGEISSSLGRHTVTVMKRTSGITNDIALADIQSNINDRASNYQKKLADKEKVLEGLEPPEESVGISKKQIVKSTVKYGVLGVVAGIFVMVAFWGMKYLLNTSLRTAEELKSRFGFKLLGVFSPEKKTGIIDCKLERLEGIGERETAETVLDRASLNIQNCGENIKNILVTGEYSEEKLNELVAELSNRTKDIEFTACSGLVKSTKALQQLSGCDGVVLVVQRGISKIEEIQKEKEIVEDWKKEIIGCLVI